MAATMSFQSVTPGLGAQRVTQAFQPTFATPHVACRKKLVIPAPWQRHQSVKVIAAAPAVAAATVKPCCKAAAAKSAAAAAAAAAVPPAITTVAFAAVVYTSLCALLMALAPRPAARVFSSLWPFLPLALCYLGLLAWSWSPDTLSIMMPGSLQAGLAGGFNPQFIPQLEGIAALFGRTGVAASWLLHILVINLFTARYCLLKGLQLGIPTFHSVLLSAVFGPLGVLSHYLTQALSSAVPGLKASPEPVVLRSERGSITLLPYTSQS